MLMFLILALCVEAARAIVENKSTKPKNGQRIGDASSSAAAASTGLTVPDDRLILPADCSLSQEQVDTLTTNGF